MNDRRLIPRNPDFEQVVRESFARQSIMATLGAEVARVAPGEVDLVAPYDPQFCQQNGFMHAGAIASLADSAAGYAAYTLAPAETDVLAVEFKINLLEPARGDSFRAEGRVVRPGRTLTTCQSEVFALSSGSETLIALMMSTIIVRSLVR